MTELDFDLAECGKGWYPLIQHTHDLLIQIFPNYEILQIKEKFGGLRYYWGAPYIEGYEALEESRQQADDIVRFAEGSSYYICEVCADQGRLRSTKYWILTLCDKHALEEGYSD